MFSMTSEMPFSLKGAFGRVPNMPFVLKGGFPRMPEPPFDPSEAFGSIRISGFAVGKLSAELEKCLLS